ncbi:S1C family serine protease [Candidatus Clostridium stratigraminis]|uniref:S1C family serine protease n=1 Tax=Candidatus Clostridium stratigraminis TaxID=3381661 RepID=A0ABW8T759_9CLOT
MENNEPKSYKTASWEQVSHEGHHYDGAEIKFRSNKTSKVKYFLKGVAFILIASVSGGVTAAYLINYKYSTYPINYVTNNPSLIEQNTPTADLPKNSITKVAEAVGPTVVGISNKNETFFGERTSGSGSGIIFDPNGYIVTNYHVIEGAEKLTVKLVSSNRTFDAKYIGGDINRDIAVIKIDAKGLPVARFGDSSKVKVGDVSVAIGNPLGDEFAGSVTAGIISAVNRKIKVQDQSTGRTTNYTVFQTDAAINPGNSGGALCNEAGEIIGINSLKLGASSNVEGMGFAITINEAKTVVDKIMKGENLKVTPNTEPTVNPSDINKAGIIVSNAVPEQKNGVTGAYIEDVDPNMGAGKAGIRPSDIITEIDKVKITTGDDLMKVLKNHKTGDIINCSIWRNGKTLQFKVTLSENK